MEEEKGKNCIKTEVKGLKIASFWVMNAINLPAIRKYVRCWCKKLILYVFFWGGG